MFYQFAKKQSSIKTIQEVSWSLFWSGLDNNIYNDNNIII